MARTGETECANLLIKCKVNVKSQNFVGKTALHIAAKYGRKEFLELLIKSNAVVNAQDIHGITPLLLAAKKGHWKCMERLLGSQSDVNLKNKMGETPLKILWSHYHETKDRENRGKICQLLLQTGEGIHLLTIINLTFVITYA